MKIPKITNLAGRGASKNQPKNKKLNGNFASQIKERPKKPEPLISNNRRKVFCLWHGDFQRKAKGNTSYIEMPTVDFFFFPRNENNLRQINMDLTQQVAPLLPVTVSAPPVLSTHPEAPF